MPQARGAFPFPIPLVQEGTNRFALTAGGMFYPPSNVYLISLDANSIVEIYDPVEQTWRTWINAGAQENLIVDGFNVRVRNFRGSVTGTTITAPGSGGTNGIGSAATGVTVAVTATTSAGGLAPIFGPIVGGSVPAPTVAQAGAGFLVPPVLVADPPPLGGIQASATCVLTAGGGIGAITMANVGAGYVATPNWYIIPQTNIYQGGPSLGVAAGVIPAPPVIHINNAVPGNQNTSSIGSVAAPVAGGPALLGPNALTGSGTLTGLVVLFPGVGLITGVPTVAITGGGLAAATATVAADLTAAVANIRSQPRTQ
jgi:hypothetical protein